MNRDNAHLYAPLVQALAAGQTIQANRGTVDQPRWEDLPESVLFTCEPHLYRVKDGGPNMLAQYVANVEQHTRDGIAAAKRRPTPTEDNGGAWPGERQPVGGLDHGWRGEYNRGWNDCLRAALKAVAPKAVVGAPKHGDDAGDGLRYVLCQVGFGEHYRDWLLIPHADGPYVTAAKLQPFSLGILRAALTQPAQSSGEASA